MSKDMVQRTLNGVPYSLNTHNHATITNLGSGISDTIIENVNDTNGTVRMHLQNRTGVNGVLFEQLGTVDLMDFEFKTLTNQQSLRLESRTASMHNSSNTKGEWQIGPASTPFVTFGSAECAVLAPLTVSGLITGAAGATITGAVQATTLVATSTVTATGGNSTQWNAAYAVISNAAPVKVTTSATQAIAATTNTKLVFGTVVHAPVAAAWDASNNRYIAQTAGYYSVKASIRATGTARSSKLMIYKNGVFLHSLQDCNTTAQNSVTWNGATDIQLAATDYLELWFYASGASTIASSADCNFCVSRFA
jgi:hypothetical protein